ncbi:hypothetical protein BDV12DRAFT_160744 [Aspergillus spectabilis]
MAVAPSSGKAQGVVKETVAIQQRTVQTMMIFPVNHDPPSSSVALDPPWCVDDEDHRLSPDSEPSLASDVPPSQVAAVEPRGLQSWYARKEPWMADRTRGEVVEK